MRRQGAIYHSGTKRKLTRHGIPYEPRKAVKITLADYAKYDYIIVMEQKNLRDIKKTIPVDTKTKFTAFWIFAAAVILPIRGIPVILI